VRALIYDAMTGNEGWDFLTKLGKRAVPGVDRLIGAIDTLGEGIESLEKKVGDLEGGVERRVSQLEQGIDKVSKAVDSAGGGGGDASASNQPAASNEPASDASAADQRIDALPSD
jgi:hypothetical protein